jgi:hypothetical protein
VTEQSDVVERAISYPYSSRWEPFVQLGHRTLDPGEIEVDLLGRSRLVAYGSNAAPEALARKLALSKEPVLVEPAWLRDFDVVYSAHISPYGAVPATLQRSRGTLARVSLAHMTEEQLALLSATEPNYGLAHLPAIDCRVAGDERVIGAHAYLSRHGCLLVDEAEVALSAVPALGRRFGEMSEEQVLEWVRAKLSPAATLPSFVLGSVTDPALAEARSAALARRSFVA